MALDRFPDVEKRITIFNCRADRPTRSQQLGRACVHWRPADNYLLMGSATYLFLKSAMSEGMSLKKIVVMERESESDIFEIILERMGRSALVVGMGNTKGHGLSLARFFLQQEHTEGSAAEGGRLMDLLSVSIGIGLGVSLLLSEFLGIAGGGLVVPGYLALHLTEPLTIGHNARRRPRRFRARAGARLGHHRLRQAQDRAHDTGRLPDGHACPLFHPGPCGAPSLGEHAVVGFIIPGLIAVWLDRRGVIESLCSLITASVVVRLILITHIRLEARHMKKIYWRPQSTPLFAFILIALFSLAGVLAVERYRSEERRPAYRKKIEASRLALAGNGARKEREAPAGAHHRRGDRPGRVGPDRLLRDAGHD